MFTLQTAVTVEVLVVVVNKMYTMFKQQSERYF